jgi:fructosamine-3-kinase
MLFNLAKSYVDAINKGAIPSIESSWSYICKNECLKATQNSYESFERQFYEGFKTQSPMGDDELKELYTICKKEALTYFGKNAVGDVRDEFLVTLKTKM